MEWVIFTVMGLLYLFGCYEAKRHERLWGDNFRQRTAAARREAHTK